MIEHATAKQLVQAHLDQPQPYPSDKIELVILDEYTHEEAFGWVFFYDSKRHYETGDFQYALAGNAPIIVNKYDGSLHETGTAYPIRYYVQQYQDHLDELSQRWALVIRSRGDDFLATLRTIRAVLGLSVQDIAAIRATIPGVIRHGSRTELQRFVNVLQAQGVQAELLNHAADGTPANNSLEATP